MSINKNKKVRLTTPIGTAKFPWLTTPDTKWDPEGKYKVTLLLDPQEHSDFLELLDKIADESYQAIIADLEKQGKVVQAKQAQRKALYEDEYDQEGNPTGLVEVKFSSNTSYTRKDGTKVDIKPALFDAQGQSLDNTIAIWGGSQIRVNFTPASYYMPSTKVAGTTLRINAVQVIELVTSGGGSADAYGFSVVEGGFTLSDEENYSDHYDTNDDDDDGSMEMEEVDF